MLRKIFLILSGNAAASLFLFARNLLVARIISVEDYGIAATFAIAMAVVEMASQLGLQQMIVQARDGNNSKFQAALQGFQVLRGVLAGVVLFFAAGAIADFMRIPEVAWAYQVMALVPVLNALQHFDIHRLNREMRFWPMVLTGTVPALISLLAIWPLAVWFGDFRVMLYALIVQAVLMAMVSHLVAERPYRLSLDRAIIGQALAFGWPLLINGFLLFAVFQGDKLIVGRELGLEPLALFAMGITMTLTPTLVMGKSIQNYFLPQLSRLASERENAPEPFNTLSHATLQATFLAGMVLVLAILYAGPAVVSLILGTKYADLIPFLALFAVLQGLRVLKTGPNLVALSCGSAINAMISNAVRVACLPLAWFVVVQGGGVIGLLLVGIAAEAVGFVVSMQQMRARQGISLRGSRSALWLSLLLFLLAGALGWSELPPVLQDALPWIVPALLLASLIAMSKLWGHLFLRG